MVYWSAAKKVASKVASKVSMMVELMGFQMVGWMVVKLACYSAECSVKKTVDWSVK